MSSKVKNNSRSYRTPVLEERRRKFAALRKAINRHHAKDSHDERSNLVVHGQNIIEKL